MAPAVDVRPMEADDIEECGALLAGWHSDLRSAHPALPQRYESRAECAAAVSEARAVDGAVARVATSSGRLAGYLIASTRPGSLWGTNAWVELGAHAAQDAEIIRDLWASAAEVMASRGQLDHYAVVPAPNAGAVDAWFRLGFGQSHVYALLDHPPATVVVGGDIALRPADVADRDALVALDLGMTQHLSRSPVFSAGIVMDVDEVRAEWEETLADAGLAVWVAEHGGTVVGGAMGCSATRSSLHTAMARPEGAGLLAWASVAEEHRGRGLGRALAAQVCRDQFERGAPCVLSDWRATNLEASRGWAGLGFRPTYLRLHRHLGH